jgi:acyl-coenzyme A thioesterase PaaI-like protein
MTHPKSPEHFSLKWRQPPPGRLIGRGHSAGDFLEAHEWVLEEEHDGRLVVLAHLPKRTLNPRGQLFGGFTPTYVDLISLFTTRAGSLKAQPPQWLATTNMRIDYLAPVLGPKFRMRSELVHKRGRAYLVETRFFDLEENPLVFAITSMLGMRKEGELGDA